MGDDRNEGIHPLYPVNLSHIPRVLLPARTRGMLDGDARNVTAKALEFRQIAG
jgi:hypothetical protein